jgi:hypothetical protein
MYITDNVCTALVIQYKRETRDHKQKNKDPH